MGFVRIVDAAVEKPTFADVVAVRCSAHGNIAPRLEPEEEGAEPPEAECAICFAKTFGERMAYQVSEEDRRRVLMPILDAYAGILSHHALLRTRLDIAVSRLNLASPGAGDALSLEWDVLDNRNDNAADALAAAEAAGGK